MIRVALDLMGGDHAPASILDGALRCLDADASDLHIVLVGQPDVAAELLESRGASARVEVVPASQVITMAEDPARGIRTKRDASVRVCARLVRDGRADAMVSAGSTGAALAAAVFTMGRLRGISRPPLAAVVPAKAGPLIFLDVGANPEPGPELLASYALVGAALATVRLGIADPRVGLLSNGAEAGKGDLARKEAFDLLAALPVNFVGNVEGRDVPYGGVADVVVTDGFTGNVLVKGLEGAAAMLTEVLLEALTATPERRAAAAELLPAIVGATAHMSPDVLGGAVLLGVNGVCVVGHGGSSPAAVASCIAVAQQAVREGLVPRIAGSLARHADERAQRQAAGEDAVHDEEATT